MALSLDLLNLICTVTQGDMLDVTGGAPSEIRELNINDFRKEWGALMDNEPNVSTVWPFEWTPPKASGGIDYAPFLEVINGWTVIFSDALYNVNIVGGNSNMSDVIIKNQVGINTANSAGLQDSSSLQAASFNGGVAVDVTTAFTGTTFPIGTRAFAVNNLEDAKAIADNRGLHDMAILSSMTFTTTDLSKGYKFIGDSPVIVTVTLDPSVDITNCEFNNVTITGTLDGNNTFERCHIQDVNFFNGAIHGCSIEGTITLGGGITAEIYDSWSGIAGGGPGQTAEVDMGGSGQDLLMRNYAGGIDIINGTGTSSVSIDMNSGRVIIDPTVTDGNYYVRGVADVYDGSTGTAVITDQTSSIRAAEEVWDKTTLDHQNAGSAGETAEKTRKDAKTAKQLSA